MQLLGEITGPDNIPLTALRAKIMEHMLPCKPIVVDYNITTTSTVMGTK